MTYDHHLLGRDGKHDNTATALSGKSSSDWPTYDNTGCNIATSGGRLNIISDKGSGWYSGSCILIVEPGSVA